MDKGKAIATLKERMQSVTPLPDEPDFTTSDETIVRFLKANNWKYKDAEKSLLTTVEYRRQSRPLTSDCQFCHDRPGFHSMRQVGHDESGRPVVYANFGQAAIRKNSVEDIVAHVTYLIENAKVTMETGASTWVFVIDCSWMTLSACNPKLGYGVANILANHYPERLGLVICVNHSPVFHGVWKALKKLLSPGTVAKVKLVRSDTKIRQLFAVFFPEELANWLMDEISLNRCKPLSLGQREFWNPAQPPSTHDPRGCPSYVQKYISPSVLDHLTFTPGQTKYHLPHPNIIDALRSKVVALPLPPEAEDGQGLSDDESALAGYGVGCTAFSDCDLEDLSTSEDEGNDIDGASHNEADNGLETNAASSDSVHR